MNRQAMFDGEAEIEFGSPDFTVVKPGRFVRCAVTGDRIPIAQLTYWDPGTNEAYRDAEAAYARWKQRTAR